MLTPFNIHGLEENKVLTSDLSLEGSTLGVGGEGKKNGGGGRGTGTCYSLAEN